MNQFGARGTRPNFPETLDPTAAFQAPLLGRVEVELPHCQRSRSVRNHSDETTPATHTRRRKQHLTVNQRTLARTYLTNG